MTGLILSVMSVKLNYCVSVLVADWDLAGEADGKEVFIEDAADRQGNAHASLPNF